MELGKSAMEGMGLNPTFWLGKRVFLTGHTGFKGSWLSLWLQSLGAQVTGYALKPPTDPSLFEVACVAHGMTSIEGDIRDLAHFRESMQSAQPEIVIHMAAQPLVRQSYHDPVETYSTNVMGAVNLFEAVRATPSVKAVVNVTTDKCYENREWVWGYRENDPLGGYDPYSSSKGCAELISAAYRSSFFNPKDYERHGVAVATARAGNVIGGGDWSMDRLVPDILRSLESSGLLKIRNAEAIRPWQYVLDPLLGYLLLAERLQGGDLSCAVAFNFGPAASNAKSVRWILEQFQKREGKQLPWKTENVDQLHEANYLKLDSSRAYKLLGWESKLDLEQTIEAIIRWHDTFQSGFDMRLFTLREINRYQSELTQGAAR